MTFFYDLNKRLAAVNDAPESKQLNERDMSRAAKGYEKYGKEGMEALAKAGREGKALDPVRKKFDKYDEGAYQAGPDKSQIPAVNRPGNRMTLQDLEKERTQSPTSPEGLTRAQQRLSQQHPLKEKMSPAKAKSFAALAEPKDKITFADKIAGAKKEVDEMLGDVAAEAMKNALGKGKKVVADEGEDNTAFTAHKRPRDNKPRVGDVEHGSKHDITHTSTGRKVTRRTDDQGISVGSETDDEGNKQEKRGRGRPKGAAKGTERVTAKATKHKGEREKKGSSGSVSDAGKALQGFMIGNKPGKAVGKVSVSHKMKEGDFGPMEGEGDDELKAAMSLLKKAGYKVSKDGAEQVDEKAVSKKQQKFMGMVHATQKGEKAPSKEVAKVAKSMKKSDAEDFAATKHKGLPEKKKSEGKKKEKTEEAGGSGTPTASSGFSYGTGIYDSLNRDLENAITESMGQLNESMSINMSDSTEGGKSLTITASDEDALKLATLLKSAGLGGSDAHGHDEGCSSCGQAPCGCEGEVEIDEVSMNEPDYPTNTETSNNAMQYSGGIDGPKASGQSTLTGGGIPNLDADRQHSYAEAEEDAIKRMMEMAGIKEAKKVDEDDVEEGNKFTAGLANDDIKVGEKIPGTNAVKKKDIDEGILASTRALWKKYQG
jgi:hypothetical protein